MNEIALPAEIAVNSPIAGDKQTRRFLGLIQRQFENVVNEKDKHTFSIRTPDGSVYRIGDGTPSFTFNLKNDSAVAALSSLDQNIIIESYLGGDLDIEGDIVKLLAMREMLADNKRTQFLWRFIRPFLFGQVRSDKKWIASHYDIDEAFFLLFLDTKHRAYSQAVFSHDTQSLEDAECNKLDFALQAIQAAPGDHILEIGSGWGSFVEHAGKKGITATSLTISKRSKSFVQKIIDDHNLPCKVLLEHFLEHHPAEKYDAIVNCGVTEHLPDYAASLRQYAKLLKPGGYVYLDASADRQKNKHGSFMSKYVFGGNASLLCLHEFLEEVAKSPFQLIGVWNDRHNYYLTTKTWAENLDRHRADIEQKWGQQLYRIFQLYLWGSAEGFHSGMIGAYRLVLQLPRK
ncbi:MAG: class I SAM-dependent methyltransferase [Kiritimatiellae bacterium]|jgi:cyclopropane-fatty-acyl-phospholipid synthase|nr:class I SAM-dependent methyltransferase [Kiritimatiellia bacterium]